jgi:glycopeptide antibiotics resistance protein
MVAVTLTWIALGHSGPVEDVTGIIRLRPFEEYGPIVWCVTHPCEGAWQAWLFLIVSGLGNVMVFVPLGAAMCAVLWKASQHRRHTILVATLVGLVLSTLYEIAQLRIPGRVTATDDVLLNAAGALLGAWIAALWLSRREAARRAGNA